MLCNPRKTFLKAAYCFSEVNLTLMKDRLGLIKLHNRREFQEFFFTFFGFCILFQKSERNKISLINVFFKIPHDAFGLAPTLILTHFTQSQPASLLSSHLRPFVHPILCLEHSSFR